METPRPPKPLSKNMLVARIPDPQEWRVWKYAIILFSNFIRNEYCGSCILMQIRGAQYKTKWFVLKWAHYMKDYSFCNSVQNQQSRLGISIDQLIRQANLSHRCSGFLRNSQRIASFLIKQYLCVMQSSRLSSCLLEHCTSISKQFYIPNPLVLSWLRACRPKWAIPRDFDSMTTGVMFR